jgi:TolA-binding protein
MARAVLVASLILAAGSVAAATRVKAPCPSDSDYGRALCAYEQGEFARAETALADLAKGEASPQSIRAAYFLARTQMALHKYPEASKQLIRIYSLDAAFYHEWACDFLLGETRRAMGME